MNPSRRDFLRRTGSAMPAFWLLPPLHLAAALPGVTYALFFDAERLAALREHFASDPLFAEMRAEMEAFDRAAERRFMAEEVRTNDHLYDIARLHNTAPRMAFYYAMTGDEDAAAIASDAVRAIMRFPKWDYFLNGENEILGIQRASGCVVAVACTADWLGDFLDADERADWLRAMGERGCEACFRSIRGMRYPEQASGWHIDPESTYLTHRPLDRSMDLSNWPYILDRTNLKAVPASALAIGAVAYEQQFGQSEQTDRWIEQAVFSVRTFRDLYAPDGSYDEGVSYANYTSLHLAQATEVLHRHRGFDLYDTINWSGFVDYIVGMTMPTAGDPYAIVNFGDAGGGMLSSVPFWIAARAGDARSQWFGETLARGHDEWSLIWHEAAQPASPPPGGPSVWQSDLDWIVARTGYAPDDLVVAMRSGGPSNHEHADRGSLIVKAFGEVLVADPYRPPYSKGDPAWIMRTTAGHSALLIDGQGHQYHDGSEGTNASDAVARLVRHGERGSYAFWTSDATPAYGLVLPHVQSVTRTVFVLYDGPAVLVFDKVITDGTPVHLQARYFGDNQAGDCEIQTWEDHFQLRRQRQDDTNSVGAGAELRAFGFAAPGVTAQAGTLPIPEERAVQHPFVDFGTTKPAAEPLLISVLMPTFLLDTRVILASMDPDGTLVLHGRGSAIRVQVADTGAIPEVRIVAQP